MTRIPDAVAVASLDTHCLIVTVPNHGHGPADVTSTLPRHVTADVLRQLADGLDNAPCSTAIATGRPCPVHDAPAADTAPERPASLDGLLYYLEGRLDDETELEVEPTVEEQPATAPPNLADAFATFGAKLRAALEQTAANLAALAEEQPTQQAATDDDPRPVIAVNLEPADEPAAEEQPPPATIVVDCAHGYGLMRDSCPGCDHEQETPHEADPATVRPVWAKRNMRRCRRCALVPSHPIHKAKRAEQ